MNEDEWRSLTSPSKVFEEVARRVAEGIAVGLESDEPMTAEALERLLDMSASIVARNFWTLYQDDEDEDDDDDEARGGT